jgi:2-polyprenyl-3-methyl-5-hydroxy-6-metoxy-1,4-benzoquinol methylase
MSEWKDANLEARRAWDSNAPFWDERMGEGNAFFQTLIWPVVERLLVPRQGERLLDVACGNGLAARRLAETGAAVVAIDFSEAMILQAQKRGHTPILEYQVLDATDLDALIGLGEAQFDGALCNMALMDMANIGPLLAGLARLLRPDGRFVFSVLHPCFNNPSTILMGELEDRDGTLGTTYSVKTARYLTPYTRRGLAMHGQPVPHPYFHRPLRVLLGACFDAGFVLDALEERSFPTEDSSGTLPLSWSGRFHEIPPVLVGRLRLNQFSKARAIS